MKVLGVFPWRRHDDFEKMFVVWKGRFLVQFCDRIADIGLGEYVVVPRGVEHEEEAEVIIFEPAGTPNTGNAIDETFIAPQGVTI
ncbi:hypothetical protein [Rhizobium sp. YK2]|uniref:hypothetical protein n=1 Tax=Rhizobium sp. YK2 TaxID=1860096 RepID=UPI001FDA9D8D|nr:hypothetical protein [Rhizobium sp. YK2]